jgi:glutamyl-tRNA reductase
LLAKQIFGVLEGVKVLVVGAGEMAELTAEYLKREKAKIFVTNRTFERATALAKKIGAGVIEWEEFKNFLKETDIVIVSTGSPDYIITKRDVEKLVKKRYTPLVFIDISVPRNVDPSISELPNVFLFNIDNLKEIADKNLKTRNEEAKKGWLIVKEEALKFQKWLDSLSTRFYPRELKKLIEELKQLTLQETDGKEEALEVFSKKIMHPLFVLIKQNPQAGQILIEELKQIVEKEKKAL